MLFLLCERKSRMNSTEIRSPREYCTLFRGLSDEEYAFALSFFAAEEKKYRRGTVLKQPGSGLKYFGYVISGTVQVYMDDINGNRMIMSTVKPGNTFGESLCWIGRDSFAYISVSSDAVILQMDCRNVCSSAPGNGTESDRRGTELSARFVSMLASRALSMNRRIQILSKLTIREKILTLLSEESENGKKSVIELSMNREDMAAFLGTNGSALSRELSKMKKEGILDYRKNVFRIL